MFYGSSYWVFMLPAILVVLLAQLWVSSTYRKWGKVQNSAGVTGGQAAERLLRNSGLSDVRFEAIPGQLTDHYDPRSRSLRLSAQVAEGASVASLAIAAHEIGHAIQDQQGYLPMKLRSAIVPAVGIGSNLGWILLIIGLLLRSPELAGLGLVAFSLGAVFAFATLPVELNASARARELLSTSGLVQTEEEKSGVRAVLSAAAFTYVAALAAAVLQLLYYGTMVAGMGGRRRR
ncbi:MAG: zinc metallopeptidase [Anaerolineales bacterium]